MSTDRTRPFRNDGGTDQRSPMRDSEKIGANRKIVGKFQIRKIRSESDPCRALDGSQEARLALPDKMRTLTRVKVLTREKKGGTFLIHKFMTTIVTSIDTDNMINVRTPCVGDTICTTRLGWVGLG